MVAGGDRASWVHDPTLWLGGGGSRAERMRKQQSSSGPKRGQEIRGETEKEGERQGKNIEREQGRQIGEGKREK